MTMTVEEVTFYKGLMHELQLMQPAMSHKI